MMLFLLFIWALPKGRAFGSRFSVVHFRFAQRATKRAPTIPQSLTQVFFSFLNLFKNFLLTESTSPFGD
ncbi:hypothetical protein BFP77_09670 [Maribacter sp. 4U21]|nr:hypothetical protein BFP77_09670 [Maribacter sp. 4U21]